MPLLFGVGSPWTTRSVVQVTRAFSTGSARVTPLSPGFAAAARERGTGTIVGRAYTDWNGNSTQDPDEEPLENIPVKITGVGSVTTRRDGEYAFLDVPTGPQQVGIDTASLPIDFDPQALVYERPDPAAMAALYREMEFFSLLKEMENEGALSTAVEIRPARDLDSPAEWLETIAGLPKRIHLAVIGTPALGLALETIEQGDVVLFGVHDLVVVRSGQTTLVLPRGRAADLKTLLGELGVTT